MSINSCFKFTLSMLFFFILITCLEGNAFSETLEPKALFEKRCSRCHSLDRTKRTESAEGWKAIVNKMKKKFFSGISDADASIIIDYLVKTKTSPESAPSQANDAISPK